MVRNAISLCAGWGVQRVVEWKVEEGYKSSGVQCRRSVDRVLDGAKRTRYCQICVTQRANVPAPSTDERDPSHYNAGTTFLAMLPSLTRYSQALRSAQPHFQIR